MVIPRRLVYNCQCFGTFYRFCLHRLKCDGRSKWEWWYLYGKSAGLRTGGTNGKVGSGWGAVQSAEVVMGGGGI